MSHFTRIVSLRALKLSVTSSASLIVHYKSKLLQCTCVPYNPLRALATSTSQQSTSKTSDDNGVTFMQAQTTAKVVTKDEINHQKGDNLAELKTIVATNESWWSKHAHKIAAIGAFAGFISAVAAIAGFGITVHTHIHNKRKQKEQIRVLNSQHKGSYQSRVSDIRKLKMKARDLRKRIGKHPVEVKLKGMPEMERIQFAHEFATKECGNMKIIAWLDATSKDALLESYQKLGYVLDKESYLKFHDITDLDEALKKFQLAICTKLSTSEWLIILDNPNSLLTSVDDWGTGLVLAVADTDNHAHDVVQNSAGVDELNLEEIPIPSELEGKDISVIFKGNPDLTLRYVGL